MNLLETLERYYTDGLLIKQTHPELPLTIWNYSQTTQYSQAWDDITLSCRGLVTDNETGEIVARPFMKFFNWEENKHVPTKDFSVFEKMDGSLGIAFKYKGELIFASRGSFTSEQCLRGIQILNDCVNERASRPLMDGVTYMFEIIYPENRIVVDYGTAEKVVMLGAIYTDNGKELSYEFLVDNYGFGWDIVNRYDGISDFTKLKDIINDNQEGFVILFSNGYRIKIKGDEYLRLHRIMTNISTTSVWEILSTGGNMESILKDVPDEFFDKVTEMIKDLSIQFTNMGTEYLQYYTDIAFKISIDDRALFAEYAKRYPHPSILFAILDGKDVNPIIWRIIKPEWRKL